MDYAKAALNPDTGSEKLIKDFNLVFEMFSKCLGETGIVPIDKIDIPYDPFLHEPLQQITKNDCPDHTILQILKKGYSLNGKVLRPALVCVSIKSEKE